MVKFLTLISVIVVFLSLACCEAKAEKAVRVDEANISVTIPDDFQSFPMDRVTYGTDATKKAWLVGGVNNGIFQILMTVFPVAEGYKFNNHADDVAYYRNVIQAAGESLADRKAVVVDSGITDFNGKQMGYYNACAKGGKYSYFEQGQNPLCFYVYFYYFVTTNDTGAKINVMVKFFGSSDKSDTALMKKKMNAVMQTVTLGGLGDETAGSTTSATEQPSATRTSKPLAGNALAGMTDNTGTGTSCDASTQISKLTARIVELQTAIEKMQKQMDALIEAQKSVLIPQGR